MQINSIFKNVRIRKLRIKDIKQVYKLLLLNRPYVGLNSKYTYFLLARDFSDTCVVIKKDEKIIGFSSGYISPSRSDTFFSWESVVDKNYRGNNFQKLMFLYQIKLANSKFFEGTVNPSNKASERTFYKLANLLNTNCVKKELFSKDDFGEDHEAEILFKIGPISSENYEFIKLFNSE